ncbi:MAG: hypothetical protein LBP26_06180 [Clostridiales bacterium]|nr:hypothetical protein [Clostridiales bacterium]
MPSYNMLVLFLWSWPENTPSTPICFNASKNPPYENELIDEPFVPKSPFFAGIVTPMV